MTSGYGADPLALAVHARESGAFDSFVGKWEKPLYNYVVRLLQNGEDAQEVVQDTFIRAHRALTLQYDAQRIASLPLRPWLFRIARNLSRNKRRGLRHELEQPLAEHGIVAAPGVAIVCEIEKKEQLLSLDRALARLPIEARELVVLRFIEEMSYNEIAATTGATEAALRGKVFRALRMLKQALAGKEVTREV